MGAGAGDGEGGGAEAGSVSNTLYPPIQTTKKINMQTRREIHRTHRTTQIGVVNSQNTVFHLDPHRWQGPSREAMKTCSMRTYDSGSLKSH